MTRWEQFYVEDPRVLATAPSSTARRAAGLYGQHHVRRILEVGCGVGRDTFFLAAQGLDLVGTDLAASGLQLAIERRHALASSVPLVRCDARRLAFPDDSYEGVYCFGMLHEFVGPGAEESVQAVMAEIWRVLQPGGLCVLTVLAGDPPAGLPAVQFFDADMFRAATQRFDCLAQDQYCDLGCTGRPDYRVWFGALQKDSLHHAVDQNFSA